MKSPGDLNNIVKNSKRRSNNNCNYQKLQNRTNEKKKKTNKKLTKTKNKQKTRVFLDFSFVFTILEIVKTKKNLEIFNLWNLILKPSGTSISTDYILNSSLQINYSYPDWC